MVPDGFIHRMAAIYGDGGREWVRTLPARLAVLSERWHIEVGPPFPDLSYNYVAPATDAEGRRCVLKLGPGSAEGDREALALEAYAGRGAVRLLRHDPAERAMLLERVAPGDDLRETSDPEATEIAASVLRELWAVPLPEGLPSLANWTASLERAVENPGPLPRTILDRAAGLRRELLQNPHASVLLHGDLHHANLLRSAERGWLAIDPTGGVGDRASDVTAFLLNPGPVPPETTRLGIDVFADCLDLDRERLAAWAFVQAVVSACWSVEDEGEGWEAAIRFAKEMEGKG